MSQLEHRELKSSWRKLANALSIAIIFGCNANHTKPVNLRQAEGEEQGANVVATGVVAKGHDDIIIKEKKVLDAFKNDYSESYLEKDSLIQELINLMDTNLTRDDTAKENSKDPPNPCDLKAVGTTVNELGDIFEIITNYKTQSPAECPDTTGRATSLEYVVYIRGPDLTKDKIMRSQSTDSNENLDYGTGIYEIKSLYKYLVINENGQSTEVRNASAAPNESMCQFKYKSNVPTALIGTCVDLFMTRFLFTRLESTDVGWSQDSYKYPDSGSATFIINNWTGTIKFSAGNNPPTYTATDGKTTFTGHYENKKPSGASFQLKDLPEISLKKAKTFNSLGVFGKVRDETK